MSSRKRKLKVVIAPGALAEISEIYRWNVSSYGIDHADRYIEFLTRAIYDLADTHDRGVTVMNRPDLRYIVIRRRTRGHGHIAVYTVQDHQVRVLHVFHSAQDWAAHFD